GVDHLQLTADGGQTLTTVAAFLLQQGGGQVQGHVGTLGQTGSSLDRVTTEVDGDVDTVIGRQPVGSEARLVADLLDGQGGHGSRSVERQVAQLVAVLFRVDFGRHGGNTAVVEDHLALYQVGDGFLNAVQVALVPDVAHGLDAVDR